MLLSDETFKKYGYTSESVPPGSNKKVVISCDYCGNILEKQMKVRNKSNQVIAKDCCNKCKYTKRDEACIAKYGTKNPASTKEVKDKIKATNIEKYGTESYCQTQEFIDKSNATKLEKYGTTNTWEVKEIFDKRSATMVERYGVENIGMSKEHQEKVKRTCLEKYGTERALSSSIVRDKIAETNMIKYGVENPFASEGCKAKIRETNLKNLGVEYAMQNEDVKRKSVETNLEKYGVKNVFQSEEIKEKIKESCTEKYGFESASQSDVVKNKIRETRIKTGKLKIYNNKTVKEWSEELKQNHSTFKDHVQKFGFEIALTMNTKESNLETVIRLVLEKHNITYQQHAKVNGRLTDFLIEDSKLILEVDGLYWHSDANKNMINKNYHAIKQKAYTQAGYRSMFFRENEVYDSLDIIESIILNAINRNDIKIFARKCSIVEVDKITARAFFRENHIMGSGKGVTFGLKINDKLVSAIQVKENSNGNYEISRFCNQKFLTVTGGFSRLLKYVEKHIKMNSLKTFIDLRYGRGLYLKGLGFAHVGTHLSFKWISGLMYANRTKFPGKTGYDEGFNRLYDCGQAKFVKVYANTVTETLRG